MKKAILVIGLFLFTTTVLASIKTVDVHFSLPKNNTIPVELTLYFKDNKQKFFDQFWNDVKRDYSYSHTDLSLDTEKQAFIDTMPTGKGNRALCQIYNVNPTAENLKLDVYYDINNKTCAIIGR